MSATSLNSRLPYMPFNWAEHDTRTARLTYAERGMFDAARSVLWRVEGCTMPLDTLKLRLRVTPDHADATLLETLITLDLLRVTPDGAVFDEVQVRESAEAIRKAEINRLNGKRGGRPKKGDALPSDQPASAVSDF
ncbi:hypothetical protein [Hydrogenophaga sp. RWCD_12]|uniref:hypothetical protein n=1 Tax=Hydrogenophaga sp. RWCD_12 TaxID=3391190 RepID=UPI00398495E4